MTIRVKINGSCVSRVCNDVDDVFDCVMAITNDFDIAADVQGWSDLAYTGEVYDGGTFTATCE